MTTNGITAAIALKARCAAGSIVSLLFNRYTAFLVGVYAYSMIILVLGGLGGVLAFTEVEQLMLFRYGDLTGVMLKREYWELILLFYLYCYFNAILRPSRWQAVLAALPLFLAYLGQDVYFLMYSNVFRFSELAEVPELFKVLSLPYIGLLLVCVAAPLGWFVWSINYRKYIILIVGAVPLALLIAAAEYYPAQYTETYRKVGRPIEYWSDAVSAENNGRFMMLLFRESERQLARIKTEAFRNRSQYDQQARELAGWIGANGNKRNVHLVIMESFLDPTLFKNASYTKDPFHPSFRKLFGSKMGFSISPVVGGKTAQAEFEALCGVPAFEELAGVEFNGFTGAAANCLPGILQTAGYQTMASNAYNPSFFNAPNAYQGMGFAKMYFPKEYINGGDTYLSKGDTEGESGYMFDSTIFSQNLEFITPFIEDNDGPPLFNYILTIYGHFPHQLNEKKRPLVLKMLSKFKDQHLERAANQMFYRSQAVADYVNRLLEIDGKSLIILVSDHTPPGQYGRKSFLKLGYLDNKDESLHMNRIMIIEEGKVKKLATIHHYDIPAMVMNSITNGAYCKEHVCGFAQNKLLDDRMSRHDDYMRVMAHASE
jgi:phosphoglycerol transferase MdoB-like AlkP superfamily enzyme